MWHSMFCLAHQPLPQLFPAGVRASIWWQQVTQLRKRLAQVGDAALGFHVKAVPLSIGSHNPTSRGYVDMWYGQTAFLLTSTESQEPSEVLKQVTLAGICSPQLALSRYLVDFSSLTHAPKVTLCHKKTEWCTQTDICQILRDFAVFSCQTPGRDFKAGCACCHTHWPGVKRIE